MRELAATLGLSTTLADASEELERSIADDERELSDYAASIGAQNRHEPYRRKLSFVWWRLGNDAYDSPDELTADLDVIDRSLRANRGDRLADGRLARLRTRVELFGFHSRSSTSASTRATSPRRTSAFARRSPRCARRAAATAPVPSTP